MNSYGAKEVSFSNLGNKVDIPEFYEDLLM